MISFTKKYRRKERYGDYIDPGTHICLDKDGDDYFHLVTDDGQCYQLSKGGIEEFLKKYEEVEGNFDIQDLIDLTQKGEDNEEDNKD